MELCPVWKNWTIASVSDQLLGELSHFRVQIVPNVVHNAFGPFSFCRKRRISICSESVFRLESVHVNMSVFFEFCIQFFAQFFMVLFREISEGIGNGLPFLFLCEQRVSLGGMWQMFEPVLFFLERKVSQRNGLSEIETDDFSNFIDFFDGHVSL